MEPPNPSDPDIQAVENLSAAQYSALLEVAQAATLFDGKPPFADQTLALLDQISDHGNSNETAKQSTTSQQPPLRIYTVAVSPTVAANGQSLLAGAAVIAENSLELVIHPEYRRRGYANSLLNTVLTEHLQRADSSALESWDHNDSPAARRLALKYGFRPARTLLRMGRKLADLPELPHLPPDISVRTFRPSSSAETSEAPALSDELALLEVNAKAFAEHPEQGSLTLKDLQSRFAESWFDPQGLFLAFDDRGEQPRLLGFHWTKVHPEALVKTSPAEISEAGQNSPDNKTSTSAIQEAGEVYVVGISPDAQGRRLGYYLTIAGLYHLRDSGLEYVFLYVDAENTAARSLYELLQFSVWDKDIQYEYEGNY